jgi:hypothetical protein
MEIQPKRNVETPDFIGPTKIASKATVDSWNDFAETPSQINPESMMGCGFLRRRIWDC